jgi:hypothetical protein
MGATHDDAIDVTVSAELGAVAKKDFGTLLHATDDVGAGFPVLRQYESPADVRADSDVNPTTQDLIADYGLAQEGGVSKIAIGKVDYTGFAADELDALVAAEASTGIPWYGLDLSSLVQANIEIAAAWAESSAKLFIAQTSDAAVLAGTAGNVAEILAGFLYTRTGLIYHSPDAERLALGWAAKKLGKDPDTGKTSWRRATIVGVAVDDISSTEKATVQGNNANTYLPEGGIPTTAKGWLCSGNPIDTRISRDWLKFRLTELLVAQLVAISNRNEDLPYDQDGIDAVYHTVITFLSKGEVLRHFQLGSKRLVKPLIDDIDDATRASRLLTLNGSVILAGSIEEIDLNITVEF